MAEAGAARGNGDAAPSEFNRFFFFFSASAVVRREGLLILERRGLRRPGVMPPTPPPPPASSPMVASASSSWSEPTVVAFHANTTTYLQLTMQEVSSATTLAASRQASRQAGGQTGPTVSQSAAFNLATKGPTTTSAIWAAGPAFRGTITAVRRELMREWERETGSAHSSSQGSPAAISGCGGGTERREEGRPLSVRRPLQDKKSNLFCSL